jgi:uridylate kinase
MEYNRILLKLSGESLMGDKQYGIDEVRLNQYAEQIHEVAQMGIQIAIVIGGGNIFRGLSGTSKGFDRVKGDQMGMLATVINSIALSSALTNVGQRNRLYTAIRMEPVGELYSKWKAIESMEKGEVAIISGGTGNPFFTTDTAAALRAVEIDADVILLAKNVDGVYNCDPNMNDNAVKYEHINYTDVLNKGLGVMDSTATSLCMDNNIVIHVFAIKDPYNMVRAVCGEKIGTIVSWSADSCQ